MARTRKPVPVHNLKVTRSGKVRKRWFPWRMRRVFYLAALAMTVGMAGVIYVLGQVELPVDPRVAPVEAQTSFICSAEVETNCNASNAMAQLHGAEDRVLVTYEQIPEVLRQAVLAAEDKDFFTHDGVDPMGIARAAYRDIRNEGVRQGGSTITQQYVKQTYLTSEQTATRKIKEAVMAVKLEQEISKEEILTRYLNTVYFGRGAYGVQAASRVWFDHDISALDAGEAAFLAGLLRSPERSDPYRDADGLAEAERRRASVLLNMVEEGYLTAEEREVFLTVPLDPDDPVAVEDGPMVAPPPTPSVLGEDVRGAEWGSEYFAEYVRQALVEEFGSEAVYGGGLRVYTTLDLEMQKAAYDAVTTTLGQEGDPSGALVALDDQGQIRAMMGGTDFANNEFNLAVNGQGRQVGSTFKMFAVADAVRKGYSIQSVLPSPPTIEIPTEVCPNGSEDWKVSGGPGGSMSLVSATKNSTNTVFAQLMAQLGPEQVIQTAYDMGVTTTQPEVCSAVLGAGEASVLDVATGYSTVANQGMLKRPIAITRVEFADGRVRDYQPEESQALTPEQAGRVTHALEQVIDGGTGRAANFGREAAGKTGTTQNNADAWFAGFTPTLTAAVWIGYPEGQIPMDDVRGVKVQGGNFPAEIWRTFMETATAGFDSGTFPELEPDVLAAGESLDPNYGRTQVVSGGTVGDGAPPPTSSAPTATTAPATTAPATTAPPTTVPPTTAPPTTAPPSTAPPTSAPAANGPVAGGDRGAGDP